jgi:hypothetical protein
MADWIKVFRLDDNRQVCVTIEETDDGQAGVCYKWPLNADQMAVVHLGLPNDATAQLIFDTTDEAGVRRLAANTEADEFAS